METVTTILTYLGGTVAIIGVATAAAYWLFQQFAQRWLQSKFDTQLETFRGEQQRQLEQLRARINREFDRARKLHEREFDVLPETWSRFVVAHDQVNHYVASFRRYPDLGGMNLEQLEEYLESCRFSGTEKEEIRSASDKDRVGSKIIDHYRYTDSMNAMHEFNRYFRNNGVFIQPEVSEKFKALLDMMHGAVVEYQMNESHDFKPRMRNAKNKLETEGGQLFEEIKRDVQARLWDSQVSND